jgi:hypothetical protein
MSNPPLTPASPAQPTPASPNNDFSIGEEYGTARKSLPPAGIVAICLAVVVAIAAIYSFSHRARPQSSGSIDGVFSAPVPGQNMLMVAVNVTLQNTEQKPSWIKSIQVSTDVGGQTQTDDAAPAVDANNYLQTLPELKQNALPILTTERKLNPGEKLAGTIVVGFAVTAEAFAARKSLTVTVLPYDEVPVVLKK